MRWFRKNKKNKPTEIDLEIERAKLDPTVWVPGCGKPIVDENGNSIHYKSYWFITPNDKKPPDISNIS